MKYDNGSIAVTFFGLLRIPVMRALIFCIAFFLSCSIQAQTKKIANASTHSFGPNFNWAGSDNLGEIMDYEKRIEFQYQYDSINNLDIVMDTSTVMDSIVKDSVVTIYEKQIVSDTTESMDSTRLRKTKFQRERNDVKTKTPKSNKKKTKGLQEEIKMPLYETLSKQDEIGGKGLFMLLLIPIGFLMVKKT